jgi:large subunit ribosomal protein L9
MDVILLERVEKLGAIGDVVTVKNGYARNYLLPNKKALRANAANKAVFEANRERIESENAEKRGVAEKAGEKMDGTKLVLIRQASNTGQLYGSVSTRDIVAAMDDAGFKVEKSQVQLVRPIKAIGMHDVVIALHPEVSVTVQANVARSPEEAELQAEGIDIMARMFEEEQAAIVEAAEALEPGQIVGEDGEIEDAELPKPVHAPKAEAVEASDAGLEDTSDAAEDEEA